MKRHHKIGFMDFEPMQKRLILLESLLKEIEDKNKQFECPHKPFRGHAMNLAFSNGYMIGFGEAAAIVARRHNEDTK
jgi:hypothetical protein